MKTKTLSYEEAAEQRTVTGWCCKTCDRYWGADGNMARYCCAKDVLCECGKRMSMTYTHCDDCRQKRAAEKWYASPAHEWDGEFPLAVWDDDLFFWDEDQLLEYLQQHNFAVTDLWLSPCEENEPREFEVEDFLSDDLHEDTRLDDKEINKIVNEWIKANVPKLWHPTGQRISEESLRKQLSEEYFVRTEAEE